MKLRGRVWTFGDDVGADHFISPKYDLIGRKGRFAELATHVLEDRDPAFIKTVQKGDLIVAGKGFGSGKHLGSLIGAFKHMGIGGIVAPSFAAAWERASINAGLPSIVDSHLQHFVSQGDLLEIDLKMCRATKQDGNHIDMSPVPEVILQILEAGGIEPLTLRRLQQA